MDLRSDQAARLLSVSIRTIRLAVSEGRLPARRVGMRGYMRIQYLDLVEYAEKYQYRIDQKYLAVLLVDPSKAHKHRDHLHPKQHRSTA